MENYFGKKLRQLRRAKDLTQEQLATYLNISYQSVSKWETGTATPDLSYVIPLARLFGVSTDELLGFEESKEDLLKKEYSDAYDDTWKSGDLEKRLEICRNAVQNYPGDMLWLKRLAMCHSMHCFIFEDNERYQSERAEAIALYEIVIENATDPKLREQAISAIVQDLSYAGRKDEAKKYALLYPEEKRDEIDGFYLEGDEKSKHNQKLLMKEFGHLLAQLSFFDAYHLKIQAELIKLFFPAGDYYDLHYIMYLYEISNSKIAIQENNKPEALAHLEKAKFHATESDNVEYKFPGEYCYTSPLFDKLSVDTSMFLHTNDTPSLQQFAETLQNKEFNPLRSQKKFQELVNSLKQKQ